MSLLFETIIETEVGIKTFIFSQMMKYPDDRPQFIVTVGGVREIIKFYMLQNEIGEWSILDTDVPPWIADVELELAERIMQSLPRPGR